MSPPDILHNNEPRRRSTRPSGLLRILGVGRWATRKAEAQAEMERLLADGLRSSSPAIEPQEPTPEVSTPSYADEINKRLDAIRRAQKTYLRDALVQGTEQDNLPAMVATAMNSGMLPRIAEGIEAPEVLM